MSTDITRGPKLCPSCGKENPPTAACCRLCSTPLDGAIQTTPTPAWDEFHRPPPPDPEQMSRPPLKGFAAAAAAAGVALLVIASCFITFVAVCTGTAALASGRDFVVPIFLGIVAAIVVVSLVVAALRRAGWR